MDLTERTYPDPPPACEWFALCDHPAAGLVAHPVFPDGVPTCTRCADRFNMTFTSTYARTPEVG